MSDRHPVPRARYEDAIYTIRGLKVMLDSDLAEFYGVTTKALNQAAKRNPKKFPPDFMFQLTRSELDELRRSQSVTASSRFRNIRHLPQAFTRDGAGALSGPMRSDRAAEVYVALMRAFGRHRDFIDAYPELLRRLQAIERGHKTHDAQLRAIVAALRKYLAPEWRIKRGIGFLPPKPSKPE